MDTVSMLNKMSFYCQPILPLVYDESMSYYETLCKVVGQLNTTGETVNKLNEGLTGEISDRQKADSLLNERLRVLEKINKKIHFLVFAGTPPHSAGLIGTAPTRSELRQWVNDHDLIITLLETTDEERNSVYAASCAYNAGNWTDETSDDFNILVPIHTSYDADKDHAISQKVAKITIPPSSETSLDTPWGLQFIEINTPSTSADGVVNFAANIFEDGHMECNLTPFEFMNLYAPTWANRNLCVAVNAKLFYDGYTRTSSIATLNSTNHLIRIAFERDYGTFINNGVKQLNKTLDYIIGDVSHNTWTHESIDSKVFDFPRYEGFQFTRGAHNVITTDDESTPNAVYTQYHANESGKLYQNLPTRLIDTVDNTEYWNGTFDIKDGNHMTFTFVTSNYATVSGKMAVRVIELSADANTTAWKYAEKEFELPFVGSDLITVNSTEVRSLGYDAEEGATKYTVFFDASFDSILANLAANKPMKFNITIPDNDGDIPISFNTGYVSALGNSLYLFTGTLAGAPIALSINALGAATIYMYGDYLPEPNPDDSDDGKVLAVNKHKWELKNVSKEDFVVTITPLSPSDVPTSVDGGIAQFTAACDKTFAEIKGAIDAGKNVLGNYSGNIWPLSRATDTMIAIDGTINLGYFGDASNATCSFVIQSNGIATITCAAGELPAVSNKVFNKVLVANNGHWDLTDTLPSPNPDGSDNGKVPTVNGNKWELKELPVDNALSSTSVNPVQNKVVKTALDGKASTAVASQTANGLMSKDDKKKLDGVAEGANKTTVIDALDPLSHNPVSSAALFEALSSKADRTEATEQAAGLMSAKDKKKLNGIEDGANKTIVDEMLSDGSTNPVQNKAITAALARVAREFMYPIAVTATSTEWAVNNGIAYKEASADRTFDQIRAAYYSNNKIPACVFERMTYSMVSSSSTEFVFASYRGAVANDSQYAGLGKYPTSLITINTTGVVISRTAGELPAVDGADNDKMLIVVNGEWAMQSVPGTTVDAELSTTSENPVQNKTVTDALNSKLPKTGGTVTGALRTNDSFSAGGTISFGEAPIGLSQTADGAAEIRYGNADVNDNPPPLSRLKVARPTADDDAATKAYVDGKAAAPILTSPVMIRKEGSTDSAGVYLSTVGIGEKSAELMLEDVNENAPVAISNLRTPTGAGTDNYAATKGYVDSKVASSGSSDFVVNGTMNEDYTLTLDKTFAQIREAIGDGKIPTVAIAGSYFQLSQNTDRYITFTVVVGDKSGSNINTIYVYPNQGPQANFYGLLTTNPAGELPQVNMSSDPTKSMQIATKKYVDEHLSGAPITIKLGTGNAATSTATFAEIKAALEAGKAPILDSATGTNHWFALNWMLSGSGSLTIQYGTFNVEGGRMANFTIYDVAVSSTGITYSSRAFTTE